MDARIQLGLILDKILTKFNKKCIHYKYLHDYRGRLYLNSRKL